MTDVNEVALADDIIELFEESTLLGAAWDTLSERGQSKFKNLVIKKLKEHLE